MQVKRGFTLIEVMIVVVIVAILASIAYPAYQDSVRKTHRANAEADLVTLANYLDRFYSENFRYDQDRFGNAVSLPFSVSPQDGTVRYSLGFSAGPTTTTYTLQASPQGPQSNDTCGNLTLTNTGAKGASGGTVAECWQ